MLIDLALGSVPFKIKQIPLCHEHQAEADKIEYRSNAAVRRSRSPAEGKEKPPSTAGDKQRAEPWEIPPVFQG